MGSIIGGLVLIGIGLSMGSSVFLGDFSLMSLFFDGLGSFWIIKGALSLRKQQG